MNRKSGLANSFFSLLLRRLMITGDPTVGPRNRLAGTKVHGGSVKGAILSGVALVALAETSLLVAAKVRT